MDEKILVRKKKPRFIRSDTNKSKKLKKLWRKPKGMHNKLRLGKKGHGKMPSPGYQAPRALRRINLARKIVANVDGMENLNAMIISSKVGARKKLEIVKRAIEKKIRILNLKNPQIFVEETQKRINEKKAKKQPTKVAEKKVKEEK